jgi:flagellar hook-associated protein 2
LDSSSTTFTTAIEDNPDQIAALFGGKTGLAATMSAEIEKYVQTGGSIADRLDTLNQQLSDINSQKADFETSMVTYETNLRAKYASLDVLLAKMKSSSSALTALSTSTTSSS